MSENPRPRPSLAGTVARYQGEYTELTVLGNGWRVILPADPARWYIRFERAGVAGGTWWVVPGGGQEMINLPSGSNTPFESKFRDAPAQTTGEWYAYAETPMVGLWYVERLLE